MDSNIDSGRHRVELLDLHLDLGHHRVVPRLVDLFGDRTLSGWARAGWAVVLVFLPWLGALICLISRGESMNERQRAAVADLQAQQESYIKTVAGSSASPADQIASAKNLLDSGSIDQGEFDALKAKAMA